MRKTALVLLCAVCVLSVSLWAQAPAGPPKPAPELKKLNYFAGNWTSEGTMQPGPYGPGGKWTSKDHVTWALGGFFLAMNSDGNMAGAGPMKSVAYFGWDPEKKAYTYHGFDSMGMAETSTGSLSGSDWTWLGADVHGGKTYNGKFSIHVVSPTEYTMKYDMSEDGGKTWKTMMDGKATKAAAAASAKPAADKK